MRRLAMRVSWLPLAPALLGGCATTPPEEDPVQMKLNDLDSRMTRIERVVANQVRAGAARG